MKTSLFRLLKGEIFKMKKENSFYLILCFPILVFLFADGYITCDSTGLTEFAVNPWAFLLQRYIWPFYALLYPIVISVFCFSILDIEYKNNYLSKMPTLPVSMFDVFGTKILFAAIVLFVSSLLTYFLLLGSGFMLEYLYPAYFFADYDYGLANFVFFIRLFVASFAIASLQLFLSIVFKTFVIPICVAGAGTILSLIVHNWEYAIFVPYTYVFHVLDKYTSANNKLLDKSILVSMSLIIFFITLSSLIFVYRKKSYKS